jgi:hypothetical protein
MQVLVRVGTKRHMDTQLRWLVPSLPSTAKDELIARGNDSPTRTASPHEDNAMHIAP